jgi:hypothetical protein
MEPNFEELMTRKSDDGLMEYVTNINLYTPESIYAALNELKKRGRQFTDEELGTIKIKIQEKMAEEKKRDEIWSTNSWKENIVDNPGAPQYYSHRAIWGFSTAFAVIFGAVLLSSNVRDKKAKWIIIGFGVLYTSIAIAILNQLPRNTGMTFLLNAGGAYLLTQIFWNKYLGRETKYRTKEIGKPLIISVVIIIPIILAVIYGGEE